MLSVICNCNNTEENFLREPEKIKVKFQKLTSHEKYSLVLLEITKYSIGWNLNKQFYIFHNSIIRFKNITILLRLQYGTKLIFSFLVCFPWSIKPNYERYLPDSSTSMGGLSQMVIFFVLARCPLTFTLQTLGTH